jgi:hypothetical protein
MYHPNSSIPSDKSQLSIAASPINVMQQIIKDNENRLSDLSEFFDIPASLSSDDVNHLNHFSARKAHLTSVEALNESMRKSEPELYFLKSSDILRSPNQ